MNRNREFEATLEQAIAPPSDEHRARMRGRLAADAEADGLLDVAYAPVDSPLGVLTVAATRTGLVRLAFEDEDTDAVLGDLAARVSPRVLEAPERLDTARRELDQYFTAGRTMFDLTVDWSLTTAFRKAVLDATVAIPYGQTGTYRSVAAAAGSPNAVRAAGTALATNPVPIVVPCHRVLGSSGKLTGYRGGLDRKRALLDLEGGQHWTA